MSEPFYSIRPRRNKYLMLDFPSSLENPIPDSPSQLLDSAELLNNLKKQELQKLYDTPGFKIQTTGLALAGDLLDKTSDYILSSTEDNLNTNDVQDKIYGNTWGDIFNQRSRRQDILSQINSNITNYDDVRNNANLSALWDSNNYQLDVDKLTGGQAAGTIGTSIAAGAASGAAAGAAFSPIGAGIGAIIGAAANGLKSSLNVIQGNKTADITNSAIRQANNMQFNDYFDQARSNRRAMYRNFDEGGPMESLNGLTFFNTGGTHDSNPLGGIPQGVDSEGVPNLVEQGEVKYNDYIFSSRNKVSERLLDKYNLPKNLAGKTFAEVATKLQEDSQERPYDPVSMNGLEDSMNKLMAAQEEVRAKKAIRKASAFEEFNNTFAEGGPARVRYGFKGGPDKVKIYRGAKPVKLPTEALPILNGLKSFAGKNAAYALLYASTLAPTLSAYNQYTTMQNNKATTKQLDAEDRALANVRKQLEEKGYDAVTANNMIYQWLGQNGYTKYGRQEVPEEYLSERNRPIHINGQTFYPTDEPGQIRTEADLTRALEDRREAEEKTTRYTGKTPTTKTYYNSKVTGTQGTSTKDYIVKTPQGDIRVSANSPEEAKSIASRVYGSTRTSVKVSEKVRVPAGSRTSTSTTSRKKEVAQTPTLVTSTETPTTPPQQTTPTTPTTTPDTDVEPEVNNTTPTTTPTPKYRRNPFATAAMMAPAIGNIGQALTDALGITNRPDYYVEQGLRRNASELNPIAPKLNTDYQEYRPYDVNLMNNQLLAQEYGAQRAARENFNKHTQAAQLLALNNAFGNMGFLANLQAQQANDAKRNATLQWNHGINKENAATVAAYDEINQGIKQQRLNMLNQAIQAKDASDTARAQVTSANRAAALTDLGSLGRYINDTNLTQALINSGVFGKLNTDMSDAYGNLQLFNLFG